MGCKDFVGQISSFVGITSLRAFELTRQRTLGGYFRGRAVISLDDLRDSLDNWDVSLDNMKISLDETLV